MSSRENHQFACFNAHLLKDRLSLLLQSEFECMMTFFNPQLDPCAAFVGWAAERHTYETDFLNSQVCAFARLSKISQNKQDFRQDESRQRLERREPTRHTLPDCSDSETWTFFNNQFSSVVGWFVYWSTVVGRLSEVDGGFGRGRGDLAKATRGHI